MVTMTRPGCECHGNLTPGCTVNLSTAMFDASRILTTSVERPSGFTRTCTATSSVNSWRPVSCSTAIGRSGWLSKLGPEASAPSRSSAEAAVGCARSEQPVVTANNKTMAIIGMLRMRHLPGWLLDTRCRSLLTPSVFHTQNDAISRHEVGRGPRRRVDAGRSRGQISSAGTPADPPCRTQRRVILTAPGFLAC